MEKLFELEQQKIIAPLHDILKKTLKEGYKTRDDYWIDKIDLLGIREVSIDKDNSDLRNKIMVTRLKASAKVWVKKNENLKTNRDIELTVTNAIELLYDDDKGEYLIQNGENLKVIDNTQF